MQPKKYGDKLLPSQEFFRYLYREDRTFEASLYELMASYAADFDTSRFELTTPTKIDFEEMSTPPWQLVVFDTLIKLIAARTVLEIGSFIGNSAMQFARMLGDGGHVTTIEVGQEFADLARENFRRNGFEKRITLLHGDAGQILPNLPPRSFDLIFIDGNKQDYLDYALKSKSLMTDKGMIVIDDVFFHGDALNASPSTDKGRGCKALLEHFKTDRSLERLLLPVANGLLILHKARGNPKAPAPMS
jgi:predicted O-methyltransferase YrrM